jgi:hypothetical protein
VGSNDFVVDFLSACHCQLFNHNHDIKRHDNNNHIHNDRNNTHNKEQQQQHPQQGTTTTTTTTTTPHPKLLVCGFTDAHLPLLSKNHSHLDLYIATY